MYFFTWGVGTVWVVILLLFGFGYLLCVFGVRRSHRYSVRFSSFIKGGFTDSLRVCLSHHLEFEFTEVSRRLTAGGSTKEQNQRKPYCWWGGRAIEKLPKHPFNARMVNLRHFWFPLDTESKSAKRVPKFT